MPKQINVRTSPLRPPLHAFMCVSSALVPIQPLNPRAEFDLPQRLQLADVLNGRARSSGLQNRHIVVIRRVPEFTHGDVAAVPVPVAPPPTEKSVAARCR